MAQFGDFDPDDAFDPEHPDPLAVARILWNDLREHAPKVFKSFDSHTAPERGVIVDAIARLLARMHDEGTLGE